MQRERKTNRNEKGKGNGNGNGNGKGKGNDYYQSAQEKAQRITRNRSESKALESKQEKQDPKLRT